MTDKAKAQWAGNLHIPVFAYAVALAAAGIVVAFMGQGFLGLIFLFMIAAVVMLPIALCAIFLGNYIRSSTRPDDGGTAPDAASSPDHAGHTAFAANRMVRWAVLISVTGTIAAVATAGLAITERNSADPTVELSNIDGLIQKAIKNQNLDGLVQKAIAEQRNLQVAHQKLMQSLHEKDIQAISDESAQIRLQLDQLRAQIAQELSQIKSEMKAVAAPAAGSPGPARKDAKQRR